MKYKDYYEILNVKRGDTQAAIKSAYRKLARKYHPDVNKEKNAQEKFKDINEAYEVLGDENKRARYDQLGSNWNAGSEFTPPPGFEGFDFSNFSSGGSSYGAGGFSDFFSAIFGDAMGASSGRSSRQSRGGFSGFDFDSMGGFSSNAGQSRAQQKPKSTKELDINQNVLLKISDLTSAPKKTLTVSGFEPCKFCQSDRSKFCSHCSGVGLTKFSKNITVQIPKFVKEGQKIRVKGEGKADEYGNKGDLYLTVKINDPEYKVVNDELEKEITLLPSEVALGTKKEIQTPNGKITISIPKNMDTTKFLRLKEMGLAKKDGSIGNLIVKVKIVLPKDMTPELEKIYEKLAKMGS